MDKKLPPRAEEWKDFFDWQFHETDWPDHQINRIRAMCFCCLWLNEADKYDGSERDEHGFSKKSHAEHQARLWRREVSG